MITDKTYPIRVVLRSILWIGLHVSSLPSGLVLAATKNPYSSLETTNCYLKYI